MTTFEERPPVEPLPDLSALSDDDLRVHIDALPDPAMVPDARAFADLRLVPDLRAVADFRTRVDVGGRMNFHRHSATQVSARISTYSREKWSPGEESVR